MPGCHDYTSTISYTSTVLSAYYDSEQAQTREQRRTGRQRRRHDKQALPSIHIGSDRSARHPRTGRKGT
jgi:hypothetical protein